MGAGKATKLLGKIGSKASTRLSSKFVGIKKGVMTIPSTTKGRNIKITVGGTVKKISEPLSKQAQLAGKKVTAVSAQADRLVNIIKTKRIVRKPIPGEATFSKPIKELLKKFDDGTITKNELVKLESQVPILERSFFADPRGRFRPSRLGVGKQKEASLLDYLSGDVTFKTSKPQILVFEDVKIQKFPKTLRDVEKALKSGKTLTESQTKRLLKFQQEKTGKFKPIGALTKEPEITLAPGEVIKKVKKVAVTLVDGKKVEIVQAKVIKASKTTANLVKKSKSGKITAKELKELSKRLQKETGFKPTLSRSTKLKPRARVPKVVIRARAITKIKRTGRFVKGSPEAKRFMRKIREARKTTTRKIPRRPARITRPPITPKRPVRITRRPIIPKRPVRITRRPIIPKKPLVIISTKAITKKKPLAKPVQVFDVFGKSRGKFVKLNIKPLTRADALSKGAFAVDRTTARTFKISPKGKSKTPGTLLKSERNYFNRQGFKLREVRIKKGRKFQLKQKYIEKSKYAIDTRSEKSGLTLAKHIQQRKKRARRIATSTRKRAVRTPVRRKNTGRVTRVPLKRKITPARRKVMLKNLAKARAARKTITPSRKRAVRTPVRRKNTRRVTRVPLKRTRKLTATQLRNLRLRNLARAREVRKKMKGGRRK